MLVNELHGPSSVVAAAPGAFAKVVAPFLAACQAQLQAPRLRTACVAPQLRGVPVCML